MGMFSLSVVLCFLLAYGDLPALFAEFNSHINTFQTCPGICSVEKDT
jgi:hypothetical protein